MLAVLDDDRIVNVDDATGAIVGRGSVAGANSAVPAGRGNAVVVDRAALADPATTLATLAGLVGADVDTLQARLDEGGDSRTVLVGNLDADTKKAVQEAIDDNTLEGLAIEQVGAGGHRRRWRDIRVAGRRRGGDDPRRPRPVGAHPRHRERLTAVRHRRERGRPADPRPHHVTGDAAKDGPHLRTDPIRMPRRRPPDADDPATELIHVLGVTPDGRTSTVYVVEPHANVVFADHKLPFAPSAWALDTSPDYPSLRPQRGPGLLTRRYGGLPRHGPLRLRLAAAGRHRGVVTVALLYLLGRILFRRRAVAIAVGFLALFDGMEFVQSRQTARGTRPR